MAAVGSASDRNKTVVMIDIMLVQWSCRVFNHGFSCNITSARLVVGQSKMADSTGSQCLEISRTAVAFASIQL